ncbi:hypothetical protein ABIE44_001980 [Marmoricola sp. OAE513]|uniref:hypothetical protein n=1 Tax=Marmoricola sp. OAE513 TaxID=2817894 RepID=UPI001AE9ED7E
MCRLIVVPVVALLVLTGCDKTQPLDDFRSDASRACQASIKRMAEIQSDRDAADAVEDEYGVDTAIQEAGEEPGRLLRKLERLTPPDRRSAEVGAWLDAFRDAVEARGHDGDRFPAVVLDPAQKLGLPACVTGIDAFN